MECFTIKGETGHLKLTIIEIYRFPESPTPWNGYETKVRIEIKSGNFQVDSVIWAYTGGFFQFLETLKSRNQKLTGEAKYTNHPEENLDIRLRYDNQGRIWVKGSFTENQFLINVLNFEFLTDQTYITNTIQELEKIRQNFGGLHALSN